MKIRDEKKNLIKGKVLLYDEKEKKFKRVFVQTWPRTAQNVAFPKNSTVFCVIDINSNEIYFAEYKKVDNRLDIEDLTLVCLRPRMLFPPLVFKAHDEYFSDKNSGTIIGIEEIYETPAIWRSF